MPENIPHNLDSDVIYLIQLSRIMQWFSTHVPIYKYVFRQISLLNNLTYFSLKIQKKQIETYSLVWVIFEFFTNDTLYKVKPETKKKLRTTVVLPSFPIKNRFVLD